MGSRNCFLALFCGIIIEKELHVLKHKVRLSLSLFALLSRRGGGDEEEEEEEEQREGKESFSFSKRKDSFVINNFRNARDLSFESSHEKKTNKNRNVIQFDLKKKKKNKPKEHHRASHSITENESNGEGRGKWRQCDRG